MIAGFMPPDAGTIEMDGQVISSPAGVVPPEKRRMSMIFQSYAIWPNMTVGENVGFGLELRKLPRAEIDRRVDRDPRRRADGRARRAAIRRELSGGQQQRVALARAIVVEPEVLLLDEPLSNLDANLREEMRFEIRRLHDEFKITTVYVTHDQAEAMVTSDRIAVMNKGRIEQIDAPHVALRPAEDPLRGGLHRPHQFPRRRAAGQRRALRRLFGRCGGCSRERPRRASWSIRCGRRRSAWPPSKPDGGALAVEAEIVRPVLSRRILGLPGPPAGRGQAAARFYRPQYGFRNRQPVWLEIDPAAMVRVE